MHEPIERYSTIILRIPLGLYTLLSGVSKLAIIPITTAVIRDLNILPDPFSALYGVLVPYTEIIIGVLLIAGLWTRWAALVQLLLLFSSLVLFGFLAEGAPFNHMIILLAVAVSLFLTGSYHLSVDGLLQAHDRAERKTHARTKR